MEPSYPKLNMGGQDKVKFSDSKNHRMFKSYDDFFQCRLSRMRNGENSNSKHLTRRLRVNHTFGCEILFQTVGCFFAHTNTKNNERMRLT